MDNPDESAFSPQRLELIHSSVLIFVLGDVIVFIIKLHYSSAIAVCGYFMIFLHDNFNTQAAESVLLVHVYVDIFEQAPC